MQNLNSPIYNHNMDSSVSTPRSNTNDGDDKNSPSPISCDCMIDLFTILQTECENQALRMKSYIEIESCLRKWHESQLREVENRIKKRKRENLTESMKCGLTDIDVDSDLFAFLID